MASFHDALIGSRQLELRVTDPARLEVEMSLRAIKVRGVLGAVEWLMSTGEILEGTELVDVTKEED